MLHQKEQCINHQATILDLMDQIEKDLYYSIEDVLFLYHHASLSIFSLQYSYQPYQLVCFLQKQQLQGHTNVDYQETTVSHFVALKFLPVDY